MIGRNGREEAGLDRKADRLRAVAGAEARIAQIAGRDAVRAGVEIEDAIGSCSIALTVHWKRTAIHDGKAAIEEGNETSGNAESGFTGNIGAQVNKTAEGAAGEVQRIAAGVGGKHG